MKNIKTILIQDEYGEEYCRHTINSLKDEKFRGIWEYAMVRLISLAGDDENIESFLYTEMTTNDEVIVGDETLVGIDIMDHLP